MYEILLECLDSAIAKETLDCRQEKLHDIIKEIQTFYPHGCRRLYVHATSCKVFDADLALLEDCAFLMLQKYGIATYWLIEMTKYFCVDYENLRYRLNQNSIARFEKIIVYFEVQAQMTARKYICPVCKQKTGVDICVS